MTIKKSRYETVFVDMPETCAIARFDVDKHKVEKELHGGLDRKKSYAVNMQESRDVTVSFRDPQTAYQAFGKLTAITKNIDYRDLEDACELTLYNVRYKDVLDTLCAAGIINRQERGRASEYLEEVHTR